MFAVNAAFPKRHRLLIAMVVLVIIHSHYTSGAVAASEKEGKTIFKRVNVEDLTMEQAKVAIQGERMCIKGKPVSPDKKLGAIELRAKDGNIYVSSVSLPGRVKEQLRKGKNVTIELEGEVRSGAPGAPFGNNCYCSAEKRFYWEIRDTNGAIIERGESKVINGIWKERILPIDPKLGDGSSE